MLYENKLCDGCGQILTREDDVVVCPVCGTPQHRACWLEHNACVNSSLHAEGFIWAGAGVESGGQDKDFNPSNDLGIICQVCGTNNPSGTEVCSNCGGKIGTEQVGEPRKNPDAVPGIRELPFLGEISPEEVIGGVKAYDIALYTQFGAKRYVDKFRRMESRGNKLSWSWGAFIFSPYWFFYRKLYWLGGIFLGITIAATLLMSALFAGNRYYNKVSDYISGDTATAQSITGALNLLSKDKSNYLKLNIVAGIFYLTHFAAAFVANPAYKKKAMADIRSIRRFSKDETTFRMLTIRRGGTSFIALMGSVLFHDLLLYLLNYAVSRL